MYVESKLANKQQTPPSLHTSSPEIYQFPVALGLRILIQLLGLALASDNELEMSWMLIDSERITSWYGRLVSVFQLFHNDSLRMISMPQILVQVVQRIHCFSQQAIPQMYSGILVLSMKMFFNAIQIY
jgi:hypothetical protein